MKKNKVVENTAMLYIMNIAKLIFPLLTLPYLTRVLSVEAYGVVTYVKAVIVYMQLIIDFGFLMSATKNIVKAGEDKRSIGRITGNVILGKGVLALCSFGVLIIMTVSISMLRKHVLFTVLSFVYVFLSIFLLDFLFRGLEMMHVITIRYLITRSITTGMTFLVIHDDSDLLMVPILEIIGNLAAILWIGVEVKKLDIHIQVSSWKDTMHMLKESFVYFLSDMASTAFGALNTVMVGIVCNSTDVAYWGLAMQLVNAIQSLYSPVMNGIYPYMIREKSMKFIKKILMIFMPLIAAGCLIIFFGADVILAVLGGPKYEAVAPLFCWFIPLLIVSFPAMLFGWPSLGAIEKTKETTRTTVLTALVQAAGLILLMITDRFTLINLALLRAATEIFMCLMRMGYCYKFRDLFSGERGYEKK